MASSVKNTTYIEAMAALGLDGSGPNKDRYELSGQAPSDLVSHTIEKDYIIMGMTPEDYISTHGSSEFNITELQSDFKTICVDYGDRITKDTKSKAVEFCSKVIYEIGPDSRKGSKTSDKVWKMRFMYSTSRNELNVRTLFIATYRSADYKKNYTPGKTMCVTVKQAGLLAMSIFNQLTEIAYNLTTPIFLLTPLAGSIFSRDDILNIAAAIGVNGLDVLVAINNSCQSGGQYLEHSSINIATVAAIVATRNVKDKDIMSSIIGKTIRQYLMQKKIFDEVKFAAYCKYAHGGVPSNMSVDILVSTFAKMQEPTQRQVIQAARGSETTSKIVAPTTSDMSYHSTEQ